MLDVKDARLTDEQIDYVLRNANSYWPDDRNNQIMLSAFRELKERRQADKNKEQSPCPPTATSE